MAKTNQKVTTATKEKAVKFIMEKVTPNLTKKKSDAKFREVAKQFGISTAALHHAYENYLNFKKVDLRKKAGRKDKTMNWDEVREHKNTELSKELHHLPMKNFTTKEIKLLIHEYYFGTKMSISKYLQEKQINPSQWYGWMRTLKISGKIGNSKVFDFTKYGKPLEMNTVFKYAKAITRTHGQLNKPLCESAKANVKCLAKLTKKEECLTRRLVKVLFSYCVAKNSKEAKLLEKSMQDK